MYYRRVMPPQPFLGLAARLSAADLSGCDRVVLAAHIATAQQARDWLDAFDAGCAQAATRLNEAGVADVPVRVVANGGRRSEAAARVVVARGEVCAAMPAWHAALGAGTVSGGHTDALARVHGRLDDDARAELIEREVTLVESAASRSVEDFTRQVNRLGQLLARDGGKGQAAEQKRQRSLRRWVDRQTGMCHTHLVLDPEADARLSRALDEAVAAEKLKAEVEDRTFDQLRADAMLHLVTTPSSGTRRPDTAMVLIDAATMANGPHADTVCETADGNDLPREAVERIVCDADIIPVALNGQGVVLDVGRTRRVATAGQRNALRAMYRSCGHPGCTVRFADCEIHHVVPWIKGGTTDMANLLPLCSRHHHLVHEGNWKLTLDPDRTITLRRPDKSMSFVGSTVDVAPASVREHGPPARAPAA